jgi:hypothetical protein
MRDTRSQAERRAAVHEAFDEYLEKLDRKHPELPALQFHQIVQSGLRTLRHYIESEAARDADINWSHPAAHLTFPVTWNWNRWEQTGEGGFIFGELDVPDIDDEEKYNEALRENFRDITFRLLEWHVLDRVTHGVGYVKQGRKRIKILPHTTIERLGKLPAFYRDRAVEHMFRPATLGVLRPGRCKAIGHGARVKTVEWGMEIHPFVADADKRVAHFPIYYTFLFGQQVSPRPKWEGLDPVQWDAATRERFWSDLDASMDRAMEQLEADFAHDASTPNPVQALVRMNVVPKSGKAQIVSDIYAAMERSSEVRDFAIEWQTDGEATFDTLSPGEAITLLRLGDATDPEKRRVFDKLVKSLPETDKQKHGRITRVKLEAWRRLCDVLRHRSADSEDWSSAVDDVQEIELRKHEEREKKHPGT